MAIGISYDDAFNTNIYDNSSLYPDGTYSNLNGTFYDNSLNISTTSNHDNSDWASYDIATTTYTNNLYDSSYIDPC
ncbi:12466_t:CDS:2, partial [Ambispora leptoticha]